MNLWQTNTVCSSYNETISKNIICWATEEKTKSCNKIEKLISNDEPIQQILSLKLLLYICFARRDIIFSENKLYNESKHSRFEQCFNWVRDHAAVLVVLRLKPPPVNLGASVLCGWIIGAPACANALSRSL